MFRLDVRREALDELEEAAAWYEAHRPGLGLEFFAELERIIATVGERPHSFPSWSEGYPYHRATSPRFPYVVYIEKYDERVVVSAVAHTSRRPGYWLGRTQ